MRIKSTRNPVINVLLLTDGCNTGILQVGTPNNPSVAGAPSNVAKGQESDPDVDSIYCWNFGDTFVFVDIRESRT